MDRWKADMGRVREEKRREEKRRQKKRRRKKIKKRKSPKKEDQGARKGRKVAKHCVFPMICGSGGSKSRLAKAAGAQPSVQMRDEKLHDVVARSRIWLNSKCTKHTILGPFLEVEMSKKVHAVKARRTFRSQNVQSTPSPDHFWKLRCRKSACGCGAKHIAKSKC